MPEKAKQHFVPRYYFRNFSANGATVCSLLVRDGRTLPSSQIKHQCAGNLFYGTKDLEQIFSIQESQHREAIIAAIDVANNPNAESLTSEEYCHLLQAVVFQRSRTALKTEKSNAANSALMLECFKHYLRSSKDPSKLLALEHLEAGDAAVLEREHITVLRALEASAGAAVGITDLRLCLLRNCTDYPFIFSDSPVVYYNSYCRRVRNRGVLGLQCPGLQIFFPLNPWTLALLYDESKYTTEFDQYLQFDVLNRSDVSQLNSLQLHHVSNAAIPLT